MDSNSSFFVDIAAPRAASFSDAQLYFDVWTSIKSEMKKFQLERGGKD
jgi:hypothetical protein